MSLIFFYVFIGNFLKASSKCKQAFMNWKSAAGWALYGHASKILLLSIPGTENDTLLWPVPFHELQSENSATAQEKEKTNHPFRLDVLQNSVLCCCYREQIFFAIFDTWLHSLCLNIRIFFCNIPELAREDSANSVQGCKGVA